MTLTLAACSSSGGSGTSPSTTSGDTATSAEVDTGATTAGDTADDTAEPTPEDTASLDTAALDTGSLDTAAPEGDTNTPPPAAEPVIELTTNKGVIVLTMDSALAPKTVANFVAYVESGHYDNTLFHRVIENFMIQGGGFDADYEKKPVNAPIENEATTQHKNLRGSVAMARTGDPHSATAQFFINVADNPFLDHTEPSGDGWGYAVFGYVSEGMEVVDAIRGVPTGAVGPFEKDVPLSPVVIEKAVVLP